MRTHRLVLAGWWEKRKKIALDQTKRRKKNRTRTQTATTATATEDKHQSSIRRTTPSTKLVLNFEVTLVTCEALEGTDGHISL